MIYFISNAWFMCSLCSLSFHFECLVHVFKWYERKEFRYHQKEKWGTHCQNSTKVRVQICFAPLALVQCPPVTAKYGAMSFFISFMSSNSWFSVMVVSRCSHTNKRHDLSALTAYHKNSKGDARARPSTPGVIQPVESTNFLSYQGDTIIEGVLMIYLQPNKKRREPGENMSRQNYDAMWSLESLVEINAHHVPLRQMIHTKGCIR